MSNLISRFVRDESGATAIEYGLIAALIAVVIITALTTVGTNLNTKFTSDRDQPALTARRDDNRNDNGRPQKAAVRPSGMPHMIAEIPSDVVLPALLAAAAALRSGELHHSQFLAAALIAGAFVLFRRWRRIWSRPAIGCICWPG